MPRWLSGEAARTTLAVGGAFLVVLVLMTLGWAILRPSGEAEAAFRLPAEGTPSPTPTATPSSTLALPTPSPTPGRPRTPAPIRQTTPAPRPTEKPPAEQLPPPPPPPAPTTGPNCPTLHGDQAPYSDVRAALKQAGGIDYWARDGVAPPQGALGDLPTITVPTDLMNAIAMTESTWRSNVIACDGGIGTMQVMPATADWMHDRFNNNFDVNTLDGNTKLGAAYLEWLTVYFGIFYFGESFNLNTTAPVGAGGATVKLGDAVIAAYNVGPFAVENEHGTEDTSDDTLEIPNQWYVDRVSGYRTNCPCDAF